MTFSRNRTKNKMGLKQTLDISLAPCDRCKKSITKKKLSELGPFTVYENSQAKLIFNFDYVKTSM